MNTNTSKYGLNLYKYHSSLSKFPYKKLYSSYSSLSSYYRQPNNNNSSYPFFSLLFLSLYTYNRCNKLEKEIQELKRKE